MKIRILYFASVKEQLGRDAEDLELPAGVGSVAAVRSFLKARGGAYAEAFADKRLVRAALNQDMVKDDAAVKVGDELAFFPPVTGG